MVKGKIRKIFLEHWEKFVEIYGHRIRPHVFKEVDKMLKCGSMENGYLVFKCGACGEEHKVGFSCKSRLCTSCGKKRTDEWVLGFRNKIASCRHRHMVFTIPEQLRVYFIKNRKLLSLLPRCASQVIKSWFKDRNKKSEYIPGIVTVIHTFGRDLKWNPHVHMLVTEGAMDKNKGWKKNNFFPYSMLRKRWQKILLDELENNLGRTESKKKFKKLKNQLYKNLKNGFYVYGKGIVRDSKSAAKYIGRYAARPVIAESRIIKYDGKIVVIEYERHEDGKKVQLEFDALNFIARVIMHLPDKNFNMIRYYGMYAKNNKHKGTFYKLLDDKTLEELKKLNKWKYRILKEFGVNPLKCPSCGTMMSLADIIINNKGSCIERIYNEMKLKTKKKIDKYREIDNIVKARNQRKFGALFA